MPRPFTAAAAAAVALTAAACGSSQQTAATLPRATPAPTEPTPTVTAPAVNSTTSPATTTAAVTSPTATETTTTSTATLSTMSVTRPDTTGGAAIGTLTDSSATAGANCTASQLSAAAVSPNSAPGETVLGFTITNDSASACHTYGWPGISLVDTGGGALPGSTTRVSSDSLGSAQATKLTLASGQAASFRVSFSNTDSGSGCAPVRGAEIIAPDDTQAIRVSLGQTVEACGAVKVMPLQAGAGGTGQ